MARHSLTFNGGMSISTSQKKFGNSSWLFDGNNDYVSIPDNTDWNFGTGDFTIECWVYRSNDNIVIGSVTTSQLAVQPYSAGNRWDISVGGSSQSFSDTLPSGWMHFALVRTSGVVRLFRDGVQRGSDWSNTNSVSAGGLYLGRRWDGNYFSGYVDEVRISKGIARWTANFTPPTEPYAPDQYTVLLCHCEGDMLSSGAKSMTMVGSPVMSTSVPSSSYGGSMQFNGSSDYLASPASTDWSFGADNFTVDGWVYANSVTGAFRLCGAGSHADGATNMWFIGYGSVWSGGQKMNMGVYNGVGYDDYTSTSFTHTAGTWNHIAFVRNGANILFFFNGVQYGSASIGTSLVNSGSSGLIVGARYGTSTSNQTDYLNGNIAGLRISKGIARWTSNFTPPNTPYSKSIGGVDGYTKLMLHMDGGNNSSIFTDSSIVPKTITVNGAVQKSDKMMFGKSCGYFNSSNLSIADSDDFNFGTGNFTIDFWFNPSDVSSYKVMIGKDNSNNYGWLKFAVGNGGSIYVSASSNGTSWDILEYTSGVLLTTNVWYHAALVRSGNNFYVYLNGTQLTSTTSSSSISNSTQPLRIGTENYTSPRAYAGYLDEVRISKGIARWTSNFTPPTKPYDQPSVDGYTKLLLHMNGTNGSTQFPDAGTTGHVVTANGNAAITANTTYKFNGSCLALDGSGDYLSMPDSDDWYFGTSDFTIDGWINFSSASGSQVFVSQYVDGNNLWQFYRQDTNTLIFYTRSGGSTIIDIEATWANTTGAWYHIAAVRSGTTYMLFVNGVSLALTLNTHISDNIPDLASPLRIGSQTGSNNYVNGYMQEFRISKGIARWTSNFAPPVRPYGS